MLWNFRRLHPQPGSTAWNANKRTALFHTRQYARRTSEFARPGAVQPPQRCGAPLAISDGRAGKCHPARSIDEPVASLPISAGRSTPSPYASSSATVEAQWPHDHGRRISSPRLCRGEAAHRRCDSEPRVVGQHTRGRRGGSAVPPARHLTMIRYGFPRGGST